jgi:hypothetical protein
METILKMNHLNSEERNLEIIQSDIFRNEQEGDLRKNEKSS